MQIFGAMNPLQVLVQTTDFKFFTCRRENSHLVHFKNKEPHFLHLKKRVAEHSIRTAVLMESKRIQKIEKRPQSVIIWSSEELEINDSS